MMKESGRGGHVPVISLLAWACKNPLRKVRWLVQRQLAKKEMYGSLSFGFCLVRPALPPCRFHRCQQPSTVRLARPGAVVFIYRQS